MSVETEVKIRMTDPAGFFERLSALAATEVSPRHFEDNFILDFPDAQLRSQSNLLRVRITDARASLTYKGPPREEGIFKVREELEVPMDDGATAIAILERLGMAVWFRYQKYRREFDVAPVDRPGTPVRIAYDETPIGDYIELEGEEENIRMVARALGIKETDFIRLSYYSLYCDFCETRGLDVGLMVFG